MSAQEGRRRRTAMIVVGAVALVLFTTACTCCWVPEAVRRAGSFGNAMPWRGWRLWPSSQVEATGEISQRFDAAAPLTVEIQVSVGSVRVERGSGTAVVVRGTKRAWGANRAAAEARLAEFAVHMRKEGERALVIETDPPRTGEAQTPRVDLVIAVPRETSVRANVNVGDLEVTGIEGELDLTTNVGRVVARDVALTASSRITANVGSITVRLPAEASFELDARTSVGDLSCEFPLQESSAAGTLVGKRLSGRVGEAPTVTLILRVNTGQVRVEREW